MNPEIGLTALSAAFFIALLILTLALLLEPVQPGTTLSYRFRSLTVFKHAFNLLVLSASLGSQRLLQTFFISTASFSPADQSDDLERCLPFSSSKEFLEVSDPELCALARRLLASQSQLEEHKRRSEFLEGFLTQEQLRANRAESQARLLRRRSDNGLPTSSSSPTLHPPSLSDAVLVIHFLWRLSKTLCEKVSRLALIVNSLQSVLGAVKKSRDNLRLDKSLLRVNIDDLQGSLRQSTRANEDITLHLLRLQVQHAHSLNTRKQAAQSWISSRLEMDSLRAKAFHSLLKMLGLLWHLAVCLRNSLKNERAARVSAQAAQASLVTCIKALRKDFKNTVALHKNAYSALEERNGELTAACQRRKDELVEQQLSYDRLMESQLSLERNSKVVSKDLSDLSEEHDGLQLKHSRLVAAHTELHREHAALSSRHLHLTTEKATLDNVHKDLSNRHAQLTSQLNALTAQNLAATTALEQLASQYAALQFSFASLSEEKRSLTASRDDLEAQLLSLQKTATECQEAHDVTSASLSLLRAQHTHLYELYHETGTRADKAEGREANIKDRLTTVEAECFQLAAERTMGAERDAVMISSLAAYVVGLEAQAEQHQHFMDTVFRPMQRVMKSVGWQINQVAPSLVSPPPSSLTTPVMPRDIFGQLPTPMSDGPPLLMRVKTPASVALTPSTDTPSEPITDNFFSTSIRLPPSAQRSPYLSPQAPDAIAPLKLPAA